MKYSQLAAFITLLLAAYGEVGKDDLTHFQEDCCGEGNLSAGVRFFGLKAGRRDVARLQETTCLKYSEIELLTVSKACLYHKNLRSSGTRTSTFCQQLVFLTTLAAAPWLLCVCVGVLRHVQGLVGIERFGLVQGFQRIRLLP